MQDPALLRLVFFITAFILCAFWEYRVPRKALTQSKCFRWSNNLSLMALNSTLMVSLIPIGAFQVALIAQEHQWGLFNTIALPFEITVLLCVVILDFFIYTQHLVFHQVPWLWKLHRVHHADLDIDVTTGTRFHPIEMILSMLIKVTFIFVLGVPPLAVIIFEVLLNLSAIFNHSNGRLPLWVDKQLRKMIVTPDMHRVHHSVIVKETHSNFGFFLSIWDIWFKTYRSQPELGHSNIHIGIPEIQNTEEQRLDLMLRQPFVDYSQTEKSK